MPIKKKPVRKNMKTAVAASRGKGTVKPKVTAKPKAKQHSYAANASAAKKGNMSITKAGRLAKKKK